MQQQCTDKQRRKIRRRRMDKQKVVVCLNHGFSPLLNSLFFFHRHIFSPYLICACIRTDRHITHITYKMCNNNNNKPIRLSPGRNKTWSSLLDPGRLSHNKFVLTSFCLLWNYVEREKRDGFGDIDLVARLAGWLALAAPFTLRS